MTKSETIGKLSEALSKAQSVMEGAKKDSSNPFFKSSYADLASVWDAIRKPLTDNGLAIIQTGVFIPDHPDLVAIETILTHTSGEWTSGIMTARPAKNDSQSVGSCVTYLRRYGASAIIGGYGEDDDGNVASGKASPKVKEDVPDFPPPTVKPMATFISEDQRKRFYTIATGTGFSDKEIKDHLLTMGLKSTKDILKTQYDALCQWATGQPKEAA
jgi:hypothetical protein